MGDLWVQNPTLFSLNIAINGIFNIPNPLSLGPAPEAAEEFPGLERVRLGAVFASAFPFQEGFSLGFCTGAAGEKSRSECSKNHLVRKINEEKREFCPAVGAAPE